MNLTRRLWKTVTGGVAALATLCVGVVVPMAAKAADPSPASSSYVAADRITLVKVADGTHDGNKADSCFINSANGFSGGDDTSTDGIVCSGDSVSYHYVFHFVGGQARQVKLRFDSSSATALDTSGFAPSCVASASINASWDSKSNTCTYDVPRGISAYVKGDFLMKAKDTQGRTVSGNILKATVQSGSSDGDPSSFQTIQTASSDPVTVISKPFADLTIDAGINRYGHGFGYEDYTQQNNGEGSVEIDPYALRYPGYSNSYGSTAAGVWKTDVDVTDFCGGAGAANCPTTFSLTTTSGASTSTKNLAAVRVGNAWVLQNLSGSGLAMLAYKLPASMLPTKANPAKRTYQMHLEPHADSFAVNGQNNLVTDPGTDEPATYDTANTEIRGKKLGANSGYALPNNNYGQGTIRFVTTTTPSGPTQQGTNWSYDLYAPRSMSKTVFDTPITSGAGSNINWDSGANQDYSTQGRILTDLGGGYDHITRGNQMRSELRIDTTVGAPSGMSSASDLAAGITWNYTTGPQGTKVQTAHFNTSLPVVVRFEDKSGHVTDIDPSAYTLSWRTYKATSDGGTLPSGYINGTSVNKDSNLGDNDPNGGAWITTTDGYAPNEQVNQVRVAFKDGAFKVGDGTVIIDAPVTASQDYVSPGDDDALVKSAGSFTIAKSSKPIEIDTGNQSGSDDCTNGCAAVPKATQTPIALPDPPKITASIQNTDTEPVMNKNMQTGIFSTMWHVGTSLTGVVKSATGTPTVALRLDRELNPNSLHIATPGWKVQSTTLNSDGTTTAVLAPTSPVAITQANGAYSVAVGNGIDFAIDTKSSLDKTMQVISVQSSMPDPDQPQTQLTSISASDTAYFTVSDATGAGISADGSNKVEPGNDLSWTATMLTGRLKQDDIWYDRIFLPRSGSTPAPSVAENTWLKYVSQGAGWTADCQADGTDKSGVYTPVCRSDYHGDYTIKSIKILNYVASDADDKNMEVWYPAAADDANVSLPGEQKQWTDPASSENLAGFNTNPAGVLKFGHISYKKATISPDGTVTFPAGVTPLALYVRGKESNKSGGMHDVQIAISLAPSSTAKIGDQYVAWIGPMRTSENRDTTLDGSWGTWSKSASDDFQKDSLLTPWPDSHEIALSSISGTLWLDSNKNGIINYDEKGRYSGVRLDLVDSTGKVVGTTATASDGTYKFANLKHGSYKVELASVTRDGQGNLTKADGDSRSSSNLKSSYTNRFSEKESTQETASYRNKLGANSSTVADVTLAAGQDQTGVDFGFFTPASNATLDKSPATVTPNANGKSADVSWDVTVKNTGNTPLTSPKISDRLSASAYNVKASLTYRGTVHPNPSVASFDPTGKSSALLTDGNGYLYAYRCTGAAATQSQADSNCKIQQLSADGASAPTAFFAGMATMPDFSPTHLLGEGARVDTTPTYGVLFADKDGTLYRYDPRNTTTPVEKVAFASDTRFPAGMTIAANDTNAGGIVVAADDDGVLHSFKMSNPAGTCALNAFGGKNSSYSWGNVGTQSGPVFKPGLTLHLKGSPSYRAIMTDSSGHLYVLDVTDAGAFSLPYSTWYGGSFPEPTHTVGMAGKTFADDVAIELDDAAMRSMGVYRHTGDQDAASWNSFTYYPYRGSAAVFLADQSGHQYVFYDYQDQHSNNVWTINDHYTSVRLSGGMFYTTTHSSGLEGSTVKKAIQLQMNGSPDDTNIWTQLVYYTDASGNLYALKRSDYGFTQIVYDMPSGVHFAPNREWAGVMPNSSNNFEQNYSFYTPYTALTDQNGHLWNVRGYRIEQVSLKGFGTVDASTVRLAPERILATSDGQPVWSALASDQAGTTYVVRFVNQSNEGSTPHMANSGGWVIIPQSSTLNRASVGGRQYPALSPSQFIPITRSTLVSDGNGDVWQISDDPAAASATISARQDGALTRRTTLRPLAVLRRLHGLSNQFQQDIVAADSDSFLEVGAKSAASTTTEPIRDASNWCFVNPQGGSSLGDVVCNGGAIHATVKTDLSGIDMTPSSSAAISNKDEAGKAQNWITRDYTDGIPTLQPGDSVILHVTATFDYTDAAVVATDAFGNKSGKGQIVGNQAWFTSKETPRSGLRVAAKAGDSLPASANMTGTSSGIKANSGIPDAPKLPADMNHLFFTDGIVHTDPQPSTTLSTCRTDANSAADGHDPLAEPDDDLCDQTPALLTVSKAPTPVAHPGKISGFAWFDNVATGSGNSRTVSSSNGIYDADSADSTGAAADEPAPGVTVYVYDASDPTAMVAQTVTDAAGRWSVSGLSTGNKYIVRYDTSHITREGDPTSTWVPTAQNVVKASASTNVDLPDSSAAPPSDESGLKNKTDSDSDASGLVAAVPEYELDSTGKRAAQSNPGTPKDIAPAAGGTDGRADMGLMTSTSSIRVVKGANKMDADGNDGDNDLVSGNKPLTVSGPSLVTDLAGHLPNCTDGTASWRSHDGEIDDGDGDPRTQAYAVCVTNTGSSTLSNLQFSDRTVAGTAAALSKTAQLYAKSGSAFAAPVAYQWLAASGSRKAGYYKVSDNVADPNSPLVLGPGDVLSTGVDVRFTSTASKHTDVLTTTAGATTCVASPGSTGTGSGVCGSGTSTGTTTGVTDKDKLTTRYETSAYTLRLRKYGRTTRMPVDGATFRIVPCTLGSGSGLPQSGNLSCDDGSADAQTVTTDSSGMVRTSSSHLLGMGVYKITETKAPGSGLFQKAEGSWYIRVGYATGTDGQRTKSIETGKSVATLASASAQSDSMESRDWGEIDLTDEENFFASLPITGMLNGRPWWLLALLLLVIAAGANASRIEGLIDSAKNYANASRSHPRHARR